MGRAIAWRERRLVFRDDRLERIVDEFARYSPRRIRLEGDAAREQRITGTFDADDPAALVLFLEGMEGLSVERAGVDFIVRSR
jgi:transmembrane sensor